MVGLKGGGEERTVAYDLEKESDGEGDEVPGSIAEELVGVDEESEGCVSLKIG